MIAPPSGDFSTSPPASTGREIDCRRTLAFRLSEPADAAAIHLVWTRAMKATHRFLSLEHFEEMAVQMRQSYETPARPVVALCENMIVGFIEVAGNRIEALFVDPIAFHQGIGRHLVKQAGLNRDALEVDVYEQNSTGRAFFSHLEFEAAERFERDAGGRPYPLLRFRKRR